MAGLLILGGVLILTLAFLLVFGSRPRYLKPLPALVSNQPPCTPSFRDQRIPHPGDSLPTTTHPPDGGQRVFAMEMPRDISVSASPEAITLQWRGTGKLRVIDHYSVYRSKTNVEDANWRLRPVDWHVLATVKARSWDIGRYQYTDCAVQPGATYLYSLSLMRRDGIPSGRTGWIEARVEQRHP